MKRNVAFLAILVGVLAVNGVHPRAITNAQTSDESSAVDAGDTAQAKIARAMSAGPANVAKAARIVDTDRQGRIVVLREGNNGFTCMPGNPKTVGDPPMCVDAPALQWYADAKAHKPKPSNAVPGITYMLAGATQRSDSDPNDTMSMPIEIGPHWMIMWPFDPKTTGLPTTHKPTGAYIMWAGTPYAHLHVMGRP
jgi:Tfp pilus assembly protein PilV